MHSKPDRRHEQIWGFFAANVGKLERAVVQRIIAPHELVEDACATSWVILLHRSDVTL